MCCLLDDVCLTACQALLLFSSLLLFFCPGTIKLWNVDTNQAEITFPHGHTALLTGGGEPLTVVDGDGEVEGLVTLALVEQLLADDRRAGAAEDGR